MLVLLQIKGIYIYNVIGEGGVLHHGTAGLYCEEVLLEVKMSCSCEEFVDSSLTFAIRFHEVVWQYVCENLNKIDMIYLLTAFGLSPGGNSTLHIYTQTIYRTTQITREQHRKQIIWKSAGRAQSLRVLPWHLPYNWGKSTEKPQSG